MGSTPTLCSCRDNIDRQNTEFYESSPKKEDSLMRDFAKISKAPDQTSFQEQTSVNSTNQSYSKTATISYPDGSEYTGQLKDGKRCGHGVLKSADGNLYEGDFQNDCMHGQGILALVLSNQKYIGQFENGQRSGRGKLLSDSDAITYDGSWKNNRKHGIGSQTYEDGSFYEGAWENGLRHGLARYILPNKAVYEGEFCNDKIDGKVIHLQRER
jgi:hypothetical protein